ncbi:MAG TPA: metallophosphoesterase, partial [Thermoanaerobaculia bacterium]
FQEARRVVDRVPVPTLVVPGNHDVPMYRKLFLERVFQPYTAYRRHFAQDLEPEYEDAEMVLVGVNTAFNWTVKDGRIPLARLLAVSERFAASLPGAFRIVVAHHELIPAPNFGAQRVLRNAAEAIETFAAAGVDLVLSGHLHQAYLGTSEQYYPQRLPPVVVLHSGTTTSSRGRGGERGRNTCNWIEVGATSFAISHLAWQPSLARFAAQSRHVFPRRTVVPYGLEEDCELR